MGARGLRRWSFALGLGAMVAVVPGAVRAQAPSSAARPASEPAIARFGPLPTSPAAASPAAAATGSSPPAADAHLLTVAAVTLPTGAFLRYDWLRAVGDPAPIVQPHSVSAPFATTGFAPSATRTVRARASASMQATSFTPVELGRRVGWASVPEWFEVHLDLGADPGFFRELDPAALPTDPPGRGDVPRAAGIRFGARAQANLNLRFGCLWLYGRTTALLLWRDFLEDDVFNRIRIRVEASVEQAAAAMFRVVGSDNRASLWLYGEYTVGAVVDVGARLHRLSVGAVVERFPFEPVTIDLDLLYSMVPDFQGLGVIVVTWVRLA